MILEPLETLKHWQHWRIRWQRHNYNCLCVGRSPHFPNQKCDFFNNENYDKDKIKDLLCKDIQKNKGIIKEGFGIYDHI